MTEHYVHSCTNCAYLVEYVIEPTMPGRISGRPEDCFPDEGGLVDGPTACPNCDEPIDLEAIYDSWEEESKERNL